MATGKRDIPWRQTALQAAKVALGASCAILLARALGLQSGMTAGIIAVLSIQGTRQETWRLAGERLAAFLCAAALSFGCFSLVGYTLAGFTLYLLLFAALCVLLGWLHALAMISVLVTHFVAAGEMTWPLLLNEALLLVLGAGCGMAVNLHLRPDEKRMLALRERMDGDMVAALRAVADAPGDDAPFDALEAALREAEALARRNQANRLRPDSGEELAYVLLRKEQYRVLLLMRQAIRDADAALPQHRAVCDLVRRVARDYRRDNDVSGLLGDLDALLRDMRHQPLPVARQEFESRALLYSALRQLEEFLLIKHEYCTRWQHELR